MGNALYDKARESFAKGEINLSTDNIKVVLIDTGAYTVAIDTDQYLSDIPGAARISTSANLGSKTTTLGVFDAADTSFSAVTATSVEAYVVYQDTGVAGTSRLIAYVDTATGLPLTTNGGDVNLAFDSGANRIFKL